MPVATSEPRPFGSPEQFEGSDVVHRCPGTLPSPHIMPIISFYWHCPPPHLLPPAACLSRLLTLLAIFTKPSSCARPLPVLGVPHARRWRTANLSELFQLKIAASCKVSVSPRRETTLFLCPSWLIHVINAFLISFVNPWLVAALGWRWSPSGDLSGGGGGA